jgi:malonyl-CoA O-methyltransferase
MRRATDSFVTAEIGRRMAERLALVRIDPTVVIEAGQGREEDCVLLGDRYRGALVIPTLPALGAGHALPARGGLAGMFGRLMGRERVPVRVVADAARLPFLSASTDMVWSNGLLEWVADGDAVIAEWSRVLRPGGLLMFATLGPDTLAEVRLAFASVDEAEHTVAFTDLHDYGDMLLSHGFAAPVMDMERLALTFTDTKDFWRDVRALGGNPLASRPRGLVGRKAMARLTDALEAQRDAAGRLNLTFEIVYGHAWKGEKARRSDGLPVIALPATKKSSPS